jgi:hypothetical protein
MGVLPAYSRAVAGLGARNARTVPAGGLPKKLLLLLARLTAFVKGISFALRIVCGIKPYLHQRIRIPP